MEVKVIGQMDNTIDHTFESANRVYDVDGVAPTMNTCGGGGLQPKILEEQIPCKLNKMPEGHLDSLNNAKICDINTPTASTVTSRYCKGIGAHKDNMCIVAMRGRNPTNPSDRTPGIELEQTLEVNGNGTSNCLTSVQKDNLVLEKPVLLGGVGEENEFGTQYRQGNRVYSSNAVAMCLNSQPVGNTGGNSYLYNVNYRIRKLTPRECWRLMDFSDEDFEKAAQVNSNTQLYRQAGNSICKNVLIAIFGQMLEGREDAYRKL